MLYGILLPISTMDLIPPEYSTEIIFSLSLDKEFPYSSRVEELGFETHNTLLNLGSLFYYVMIILILMIISLFANMCKNKCKNKFCEKLRKSIPISALFNFLFIIFFEGFMEMGISCYLNFKNAITITNSDWFSYVVGCIVTIICSFCMPYLNIYVMKKTSEDLNDKKTR